MADHPATAGLGVGALLRTIGGACLFLVVTGAPVAPAWAQTVQVIQGRVLDQGTDEPVPGATVTLLDRSRQALRRTVTTDREGAFSFSLSTRGPVRYHLRASRIGYAEVTSPPFDVIEGETLELELHLSTDAIPLAPLTVVSDRPALLLDERLERWDYYDRKRVYSHLGAHFLEWDEIQRRDSWSLVGVLRSLPGVRIYSAGGRRIEIANRRGRPFRVCIDGHLSGELRAGEITLDELVVPSHVMAIEVYPGIVEQGQFRCNLLIWTGVPPTGRDR